MAGRFHAGTVMLMQINLLNAHSENCLFCLQFKKITVYSFATQVLHYSVNNVAEGGRYHHDRRINLTAKLRVTGTMKNMLRKS